MGVLEEESYLGEQVTSALTSDDLLPYVEQLDIFNLTIVLTIIDGFVHFLVFLHSLYEVCTSLIWVSVFVVIVD